MEYRAEMSREPRPRCVAFDSQWVVPGNLLESDNAAKAGHVGAKLALFAFEAKVYCN
jgi:hypothetical protein